MGTILRHRTALVALGMLVAPLLLTSLSLAEPEDLACQRTVEELQQAQRDVTDAKDELDSTLSGIGTSDYETARDNYEQARRAFLSSADDLLSTCGPTPLVMSLAKRANQCEARLGQGRGAAPTAAISPAQILSAPDAYNGRVVAVEGRVASLQQKISRKGNPYTTFELLGRDGTPIHIFSFGHLPVQDGEQVQVTGRFDKVKQVSGRVFRNEIDASEGKVEAVG